MCDRAGRRTKLLWLDLRTGGSGRCCLLLRLYQPQCCMRQHAAGWVPQPIAQGRDGSCLQGCAPCCDTKLHQHVDFSNQSTRLAPIMNGLQLAHHGWHELRSKLCVQLAADSEENQCLECAVSCQSAKGAAS